MKRYIALMIAFILCLALAACGDAGDNAASDAAATTATTATAAAAAADPTAAAPTGGEEDSIATRSATEPADVSATIINTQPETEPATDAGTMTVEEFLMTSDGRAAAKEFKDSAEASGNCVADCYAEGDTLVFEGKFIVELTDEQRKTADATIKQYLASDELAYGMQQVIDGLKDYGVRNPSTKIVFRAMDGSVLGEKTFY